MVRGFKELEVYQLAEELADEIWRIQTQCLSKLHHQNDPNQPIAKNKEQITNNQEPKTKNQGPVTNNQEPKTTYSNIPITLTPTPSCSPSEPRTTMDCPSCS